MLGPNRLPEIARACLLALGAQLRTLKVASEYLPENFLATSHGLFGLAALVGTGKHFNKRSPLLDQSRSRLFEIVGVVFAHKLPLTAHP
jgi:hypothetical protein